MTATEQDECRRRKYEYKRRVREYAKMRHSTFAESDTDKMGNLLVYPDCLQSLLDARVRISAAYRRWKRYAAKVSDVELQ